jgi:hypothetical protein
MGLAGAASAEKGRPTSSGRIKSWRKDAILLLFISSSFVLVWYFQKFTTEGTPALRLSARKKAFLEGTEHCSATSVVPYGFNCKRFSLRRSGIKEIMG